MTRPGFYTPTYHGILMKVLITGANGKTGKAVIRSLLNKKVEIRVIIHRPESIPEMQNLGVEDIVVGDMHNSDQMKDALRGIDSIYLIISNMNPQEKEIGSGIIHLCEILNVKRLIYHSVLHPQVSSMPHHWQKLQVEELLFTSSLDYTILQPAAYMQNILGYRNSINSGIYPVPYSVDSRISLIDLQDVADVAAKVVTEPGYSNAIYELVGTSPISQIEIANALSHHLNRPVEAKETPIQEWENSEQVQKMPAYVKNTLKSMFHYYAEYGFAGNNHALTWLLNRTPTTLEQFLKRDYISTY